MGAKIIDLRRRRKPDATAGPAAAEPRITSSLYDSGVQRAVKEHIRRIWDLKRTNHGFTQLGLASGLGLNQPAVSRLLMDDEGHPWTVTHLMAFGTYLGLTVDQLLPETHRESLRHFFRAWSNEEADERSLLRDCLKAVDEHFARGGVRLSRSERAQLGARLCVRLQGNQVDDSTLEATLTRVVLQEAQAMARRRSKGLE